MQKLLVPFDRSENATRALQHAIQLAKSGSSIELHIVQAFEPPAVRGEVDIPEEMARAKRLLGPAVEMTQAAGVEFRTETLVGEVAKVLANYAKQHDCGGIVMGTRGMGAIGNLVMGSVATKVIHLTDLPVTLVK